MSSFSQGSVIQYAYGTFTANGTLNVPAGWQILAITTDETASHAVTGGLDFGTTNGGQEIAAAATVSSNTIAVLADTAILLRAFSASVDTTVYINAHTAWNGASVNVTLCLSQFI